MSTTSPSKCEEEFLRQNDRVKVALLKMVKARKNGSTKAAK